MGPEEDKAGVLIYSHGEIAGILQEGGNRWTTTAERSSLLKETKGESGGRRHSD